VSRHNESGWYHEERAWIMIELPYSLIIEATVDPTFFGFFSPDLPGFSGVGHSVEDCIYQAKWGMKEHLEVLEQQQMPIPPRSTSPTIVVQNESSSTSAA